MLAAIIEENGSRLAVAFLVPGADRSLAWSTPLADPPAGLAVLAHCRAIPVPHRASRHLIVEDGWEQADRIRSAADRRHQQIGQAVDAGEHLRAGFPCRSRSEIADQLG